MADFPRDPTGDALRLLVEHGSDLDEPLVLTFTVAVPDREAGEAIAARARKLGFDAQMDREDGEWTCYCKREVVADYETVRRLEGAIDEIAGPLGGHADGFGSFGNQTSAADMRVLVDCCIDIARRMDARPPSRAACHEFLAALLARKQFVEGARDGIITRDEACTAVGAHIQTFLHHELGVLPDTRLFELPEISAAVRMGLLGE